MVQLDGLEGSKFILGCDIGWECKHTKSWCDLELTVNLL